MGGVAKGVTELFKKDKVKEMVEPVAKAQAEKVSAAGAAVDEAAAARRRARRGGRALLSEARLAPEQGVTTLGNTGV